MYFRPNPDDDDFSAEWNEFFSTGDTFYFDPDSSGGNIILLNEDGQPSGVPVQISKNWHSGNAAAYWAGFDGTWWTGNVYLLLPPGASQSFNFALAYEKYGGVPLLLTLRPFLTSQTPPSP